MGAGIAQVCIQGGVEDLDVKRELFAELDRLVGGDAILATNTSALSVTEIAAATERPERVVGMHFFNPAPLMALVEIVRTELTADEVFEAAYAFAARVGKTPIRCHDTPGFVVNRVLIPLLNDCLRVLDEARVTPEDLDKGMKHGAGWPMCPCELVDLVGIDIHVHASEALYAALREPRMAPPPRLVRMAQAGLLRLVVADDERHPRVVAEREVADRLARGARASRHHEPLHALRLAPEADREIPRLRLHKAHRDAEPRRDERDRRPLHGDGERDDDEDDPVDPAGVAHRREECERRQEDRHRALQAAPGD